MKAFLPLAALLGFCPWLHAALVWQTQQLEFHPSLYATEVKAEFRFVNQGKDPVTIDAIVPSCGCTTAVTDQLTYQPGKKGVLTATFHVGQMTGLQNKSINIRFKGDARPVILTMITHLPDLMDISPRMLSWQAGDALKPQTMDLSVLPGAKVSVKRVLSTDPAFTATLKTVTPGKEYHVIVTPVRTTTPVIAVLSIDATVSSDLQKIFTGYAQVQAAGKPPTTKPSF